MIDLFNDDCLVQLQKMESESVDLLVTDPPYGYSFMGKDWDKAVPRVEIWKECLRVLKSGAFAFVMSAPRSDVQAEMILKLKEAGFEVGFSPIYWAYASGFPKASNISKMVDKRLGIEPKIVGKNPNHRSMKETNSMVGEPHSGNGDLTKPSSQEAKELDGLFGGFQPKPAVEVVLVVMKPCSEKTFVEQALKNGHGGTWLGNCRIPYASENDKDATMREGFLQDIRGGNYGIAKPERREDLGRLTIGNNDGRFPANLLVSNNVLDNGEITKSTNNRLNKIGTPTNSPTSFGLADKNCEYNDVGGFSRYFSLDAWWDSQVKKLPEEQQKTFPFLITPKASKSEKNKGCEQLEMKNIDYEGRKVQNNSIQRPDGSIRKENTSINNHPTVKPLKLMQYLVTLGSKKGEIVLDPFVGSGTTCIASFLQGRNSIGIEMSKEYFEIAKARCKIYQEQELLAVE